MAGLRRLLCKWCQEQLCYLSHDIDVVFCRRCDSAPATNPGNRLWATAPNASGTKNGWWLPPREWIS